MSTIIFTERMKTVMKRWLTIQYPKCVGVLIEVQTKRDKDFFLEYHEQDHLVELCINEIKIMIDFHLNWEDGDNEEDENCMVWDKIELRVAIYKKGGKGPYAFNEHGQSLDKLLEKINALDKWEYCTDCTNNLAELEGFCCVCYPWVTTQEEDCCVCMDNSLKVWTKLPCNHILHESCFNKMQGMKCPLCRADHGWERVKI